MSCDVKVKLINNTVDIFLYDHTTKRQLKKRCLRNEGGIIRTKSYAEFVSNLPVEIEYFIISTSQEVLITPEVVTRTFGLPELTVDEDGIFDPIPLRTFKWLQNHHPLYTKRRHSCPLLLFASLEKLLSTDSSISDLSHIHPLSSGDDCYNWDPADPTVVCRIPREIFQDPRMEQEAALAWDHNGKRSILEAFECVSCYRLPVQNAIWTCGAAHPICTQCLWQIVDPKCPKCRAPYFTEGVLTNLKEDSSLTRLYNNVATQKAFECMNSPCSVPVMTLTDALLHEQYCTHKLIPCPVSRYYGNAPFRNAGCDEIVGIKSLINHLNAYHCSDGFMYFHHELEITNDDEHKTMQFQFTTEIGNHKRPHVFVGKRNGTVQFCAIMIPRISGDYSESSYITSVDLQNQKLINNDDHFMSFSIFAVYSCLKPGLKCRYNLSVGPYEQKWPTPDSTFGVRSLEGLAKPWVERDRSYAICRLKVLSQNREWDAINAAKDSNFLQLNNDELTLSMKTLQLISVDKSRTTKNGKLYYTLTFALYENGEMPSNRVAWMDSWMDPQHHNILNTVHEYATYYNI